jgi:hypothetical protein
MKALHDLLKWLIVLTGALISVSLVAAGCAISSTVTPTPTIPPKQPEPGRPRVEGQISGISDNALVKIHIHTSSGQEIGYVTQQGNGPWEAIVRDVSGLDYIMTAEAKGYASKPVSYTIHLSGTTAYIVEGGQITAKEALRLDFHFARSGSP